MGGGVVYGGTSHGPWLLVPCAMFCFPRLLAMVFAGCTAMEYINLPIVILDPIRDDLRIGASSLVDQQFLALHRWSVGGSPNIKNDYRICRLTNGIFG